MQPLSGKNMFSLRDGDDDYDDGEAKSCVS
jgi:hypothetical protein